MRFGELLLGGNPGIGAGALGALCDGSGGGSPRPGLLLSLQVLDLSRCGLTAADLVGFSSATGEAAAAAAASSSAPAVCLRALVLRDNPLTRVGCAGARGGSQHWSELARRGADALRDLIARAPELEMLDLSGERDSDQPSQKYARSTSVTAMCCGIAWRWEDRDDLFVTYVACTAAVFYCCFFG